MRHLCFCVIASVILLSGCQRDISGTYLASDNATVCWLQLVRTTDNHLTGQLATSMLKPDGSIDRNSISVTGAVNGENVTLSASRFLGLQTVTFSGTLQGNRLMLTSVEPAPFILKRSTFRNYQEQVAALDARSQTILSAKAAAQSRKRTDEVQRNFVAEIDQLIANMQRFDSEADVHLSRFPNVERGYQSITAKIAAYVERERQLTSNPNASVARSQIAVGANQVSLATDQLHYQGQSLQSTFETNVKPTADEVTTVEQKCHDAAPGGLTSMEADSRKRACGRLLNSIPLFRQKYNATVAGLARLEQVYLQERNTQQGLLQSAQKLE